MKIETIKIISSFNLLGQNFTIKKWLLRIKGGVCYLVNGKD